MSAHYTVIVGDLTQSRKIRERARVGEQVEAALGEINRHFEAAIHARLVTTRGMDEISGVLKVPREGFDIAVALNEQIWPERFRMAMATRTLDVAVDSRDASAMDGPAFHAAADALSRAKREGLPFAFAVAELSNEINRLLEATARLHALALKHWTEPRLKAVTAYRRLGTQQKVADALGISQQSVSEALHGAFMSDLVWSEEAIRGTLGMVTLT